MVRTSSRVVCTTYRVSPRTATRIDLIRWNIDFAKIYQNMKHTTAEYLLGDDFGYCLRFICRRSTENYPIIRLTQIRNAEQEKEGEKWRSSPLHTSTNTTRREHIVGTYTGHSRHTCTTPGSAALVSMALVWRGERSRGR